MKKNKLLIIFTFLFLILAINVEAEELGSIKGNYTYDDKPLNENIIHLYKIADFTDVDAEDKFIYLDNYSNLEININDINNNEWQNFANILKTYIESNVLDFDYEVTTDREGNYEFNELSQGLYLMLIADLETELAYYKTLPTLLSIPNYNEVTMEYTNDIIINNKIEETLKPLEQEETIEPTPEVPQTSDDIIIYQIIFIIALIILIGISIYMYKNKKEMKNNENKE